jgi:hypothetical protein
MYTTFITTKDVASAFINSKRGGAVAEQFEAIYEDLSQENVSKQNYNALNYIKDDLTVLIRSGVLAVGSKEELMEVLEGLVQHLQWNA